MKIYISGKITDTTDFLERFQFAEDHLQALGHETVNPALIGIKLQQLLPFTPIYETYMAVDLAIMQECDAIYLLKGFENSPGSRRERTIAVARGLKVFYQGDHESELVLAG